MSGTLEKPVHHVPLDADMVHRIDVDLYHAMMDSGAFAEDEKFELLDGVLVKKMTIYPRHAFAVNQLACLIIRGLPVEYSLRPQNPITLTYSEPEPDIVIVNGTNLFFEHRHPIPSECLIVIEVSESSLNIDQGSKKAIYARDGIAEYWIVNLIDNCVDVYQQPKDQTYTKHQRFQPGDSVPVILHEKLILNIKVSDLLSK